MEYRGKIVRVQAPARLHMGFVDLNGDLGRSYGSLGLTLAGIQTQLTAKHCAEVRVQGPSSDRATRYVEILLKEMDVKGGVEIEIESAIPAHVGLGSGTQLGLAISAALVKLFQIDADVRKLAPSIERGARSGIGLGAFESGGFVVDGGRGANTVLPPVVSRFAFPESWRAILVFDKTMEGVSGQQERTAFKKIRPMRSELSGQLCRRVLMQLLPALAERDIVAFGAGVTAIQDAVGDYFAEFQGGRYRSQSVAEVLHWFAQEKVHGYGQSSWGPTGFALMETEDQATQLVNLARQQWNENSPVKFTVCRAQNSGAQVDLEEPMSHAC